MPELQPDSQNCCFTEGWFEIGPTGLLFHIYDNEYGTGSNPLSFFLLHNLQFKIILDGVGQHNLQEPVPSCFFILSTWSGKDTRAIYGPPHRTAPKLAIVNSPHLPFTPFSSYCATILHSM